MDIQHARRYFLIGLCGAVLSLCLNLLFSLTLFYHSYRDNDGSGLYALSQFFPFAMSSKELVIATPFDKGPSYYDNDLDRREIEEMLVRYYLDMRYSYIPDSQEMMVRWGKRSPMLRLSTPAVHQKVTKGDLKETVTEMTKKGIVKTVDVTSVVKGRNQFNVEMDVYSVSPDLPMSKETYTIRLDYRYSDSRKRFNKDFVNPYGLYFTHVEMTKKTR